MGRGEKVLKKLTMVYIQNDLTLEYTAHILNILTHAHFKLIMYFNILCKWMIEGLTRSKKIISLSLSLSQKKLESSDLITLLIIIFFENDLLC